MLRAVLKCTHRVNWIVATFACVLVVTAAALSAAPAMANRDSVAVIIGNKDYSRVGSRDVVYARNDAEAMKTFVIERLGYRPSNVMMLEDATLGDFIRVFGTEDDPAGELWDWSRPSRSNVFVYYSGHGAPDVDTKDAYLIPTDIDPNRAKSGYSLELLDRNLAKLRSHLGPSSDVVLVLDACFSGNTNAGPITDISAGLVPRIPQAGAGIIRLDAAHRDQVANWDRDARLGVFTAAFLGGVRGEADDGPGGNGDGKVTWSELAAHLEDQTTHRARRLYGRDQRPSIPAKGPAWTFQAVERPAEREARACRQEPGRWRQLASSNDLEAARQALKSFECDAIRAKAAAWVAEAEKRAAAERKRYEDEQKKLNKAKAELARQREEIERALDALKSAQRSQTSPSQAYGGNTAMVSPPAGTAARQGDTLWDHNGSVMRLIANGKRRQFIYERPRPGMYRAGARSGHVLFHGARSGNHISGTAYFYSRRCGRVSFRAEGTVQNNERFVFMRGYRPRLSRSCRRIGRGKRDDLAFSYLGQ